MAIMVHATCCTHLCNFGLVFHTHTFEVAWNVVSRNKVNGQCVYVGLKECLVFEVLPVERAAASADVRASLTSLWSSSCMRQYIDLPVCSDCGQGGREEWREGGREGGREEKAGKLIHSHVGNIKSKKNRRG